MTAVNFPNMKKHILAISHLYKDLAEENEALRDCLVSIQYKVPNEDWLRIEEILNMSKENAI